MLRLITTLVLTLCLGIVAPAFAQGDKKEALQEDYAKCYLHGKVFSRASKSESSLELASLHFTWNAYSFIVSIDGKTEDGTEAKLRVITEGTYTLQGNKFTMKPHNVVVRNLLTDESAKLSLDENNPAAKTMYGLIDEANKQIYASFDPEVKDKRMAYILTAELPQEVLDQLLEIERKKQAK